MVSQKNSQSNLARRNSFLLLGISAAILILLNVLSSRLYWRFDLTKEKRYSVSQPTKRLMKNLDDYVFVEIFLDGELGKGMKRLRNAVGDLMNEFKAYGGSNFDYKFTNPIEGQNKEQQSNTIRDFAKNGLFATNLKEEADEGLKETIIFPCAKITYKSRTLPVNFLENQLGYSPEDKINHSIIGLEYKFAGAINKLLRFRKPAIAFTEGHGELLPVETADFARTLEENLYQVKRIDITKNYRIPDNIDALIIAKPTQNFDERDKYKIDQFVMKGGKVLWLVDDVWADMDSLRNEMQMFMAYPLDINIDDMLFDYGVRINYDLVQDAQNFNYIPLKVGTDARSSQMQLFPWFYFPLLISANENPIVRNLDPVAGYFTSTLDTIKSSDVRKTILLQTSMYSRALLAPARVHLGLIREKPDMTKFKQPFLPCAVLLEGKFKSVFRNRIASSYLDASDTIKDMKFVPVSKESKMIVVSDGDIIRNNLQPGGGIFPLGYYDVTGQTFANKDFLLNCIEYMVDDNRLIETRGKDIKVRMLDRVRAKEETGKWRMINILLPLLMISLFGIVYNYRRRSKYAK